MQDREHIVPARLAAYHDGELAGSEADLVEDHLSACKQCRRQVETMGVVDRLVSTLPEPMPVRNLWPDVETAVTPRRSVVSKATAPLHPRVRRWAAAAALALTLIGGGVLSGLFGNVFSTHDEATAAFGFDYGAFLTGLNAPAEMERFDRAYGRRELSVEEALSAAEVTVDRELIEQIPVGLDLRAVYVLSNETARAVQITYGHNGTEISVFKQPEGLPVRFAGYRIESVAIGTRKCLMVDSGRYCAITFSTEGGQYVVVGRNDDMHVARVIDELLASL